MARDTTKSHQPRKLGLAPGRSMADVSINNPPTFNPSRRKATGARNAAALAEKKQQSRSRALENRAKATPSYNPSKQRATGSPTLNSEIRRRKATLRKKITHEAVVRRSKQA
tara:strand:- start:207 stop:542 length:336 start_codon:yes stop_codon:yes gene_type:complete